MSKTTLSLLMAAVTAGTAPVARAALYSYYVGTDNLPDFTTGTYSGLPNPNYNRLTLLLGHSYPGDPANNHFHRLGAYSLSGPASAPVSFFTNARVPEGTSPALPLQPGSGVFAGKLISSPVSDPVLEHYSHLTIAPVNNLKPFSINGIPNEPEDYLYSASGGRFSATSLLGTDVHFHLISLTPGLHAGTESGVPLFSNPGDEHHLGDGDTFTNWTPWFWTDENAAPGLYAATFKLTDEAGLFGDSGEFRWEFQVVPEPGGLSLMGGLLALGVLRRQRQRCR